VIEDDDRGPPKGEGPRRAAPSGPPPSSPRQGTIRNDQNLGHHEVDRNSPATEPGHPPRALVELPTPCVPPVRPQARRGQPDRHDGEAEKRNRLESAPIHTSLDVQPLERRCSSRDRAGDVELEHGDDSSRPPSRSRWRARLSSGIMKTPARTRGTTSLRTGSVPSARQRREQI